MMQAICALPAPPNMKTGVVPDHVGRCGECADGLHHLAQGQKQSQSEEGANAPLDEPESQKEQAQCVDERGTYDEERIGGSRVLREVGVEACGQVVNGVADSRCRSDPGPNQRLRPEPQRQDDSGYHKPKKQAPPLKRVFGLRHEALSITGNRTKLFAECTLRHLQRQFARLSQVEFSRAKIWKLLNTYELVRPGTPESRQFTLSQSF